MDLQGLLAGGDVVVLTGAGVSAESGVDTFRDAGGLWDRFPQAAGSFSQLVRFLIERPWDGVVLLRSLRDALASAVPNPGHLALAALERAGIVRTVITQNVDGLHAAAGNRRVLELHGSFRRRRCVSCGVLSDVEPAGELDRMASALESCMVTSPAHLLTRCGCGGLQRFDIVAFGEDVHGLDEARHEAASARVLLVCGTSGCVYPAAGLPALARDAGAVVVEVNPEDTELSDVADHRVRGRFGDVLPSLLAVEA